MENDDRRCRWGFIEAWVRCPTQSSESWGNTSKERHQTLAGRKEGREGYGAQIIAPLTTGSLVLRAGISIIKTKSKKRKAKKKQKNKKKKQKKTILGSRR